MFTTLPLMAGHTFGSSQILAVAIAILALALSAFVSGSEISYFSLTSQQIDDLDDSPRSSLIRKLAGMPERLLATILIANNLVNVTIVVLLNFALGPVFDGMPEWVSFVLQTVILTFLILLFGEILPKLFANSDPMKWAERAAPTINALVSLFKPLSGMLMKSSFVVNRLVTKKTQNISTDDLSQALEITDSVTGDDREMLQGILRFGDRNAGQIMTPRVDITDLDVALTFDEVLEVVVSSGFSRLPVYEDTQDNIRGVLYSRDLLPYIGTKVPEGFQWQSLLREAFFVPESRMIDDLLEDFRSRKIHMAVVIDEFGGTQGIVTLEDILEEIVGDIDDEYDEEATTWRRLSDGAYIFEGRTTLNDFFHVTGLNEDDYAPVTEDCETLAGMLLAIKGDFPKEKESLGYGRCRFLILDIVDHRITQVRVRVLPDPADSTEKN